MTSFRVTVIILILASGLYCQEANCRFSVPVNVTDAKTLEPLDGFGPDSFQIQIGKQKLVPSAVAHRSIDRVFLFIDASGSMRSGHGKWAVVMQTAYELLTTVSPKTPITTEIFAERSRSFANRDEAYSYLKHLGDDTDFRPLGGRTELYDAVASAVKTENIGIDDAVLIITDGADTRSDMNESTFTRELADRAIHPAFLFLSPESALRPETVEEQIALAEIPRIAEALGGFVVPLPRWLGKKPGHVLPPQLYTEALAYYRVTFDTPIPEKQQMKVTILTTRTRKFEIHAPNRLPSCSALP